MRREQETGPRRHAEEFTSFVHCIRKEREIDRDAGRYIDLLMGG